MKNEATVETGKARKQTRRATPGLQAHKDKACGTACRFCKQDQREGWAR